MKTKEERLLSGLNYTIIIKGIYFACYFAAV